MAKTFKLLEIAGNLHFPHGGVDNDSWNDVEHQPRVLMKFYPAGDMDLIPWPMVSDYHTPRELRVMLAEALYDERETNPWFPNDAQIELPDGTRFYFDAVLVGEA